MTANQDIQDILARILRADFVPIVELNLTTSELSRLRQCLEEHGQAGDQSDDDDQAKNRLLVIMEEELTRMFQQREQQDSEASTSNSPPILSKYSILKPLSLVQFLLDHLDAAEASMATFFQKGIEEFESMSAFFLATGDPSGSNIWIGFQYYKVLMQQRKFALAEAVIKAWIPGMEDRFGPSNPRTLGGVRALIEALAGQKKFTEANEVTKECWRRVEAMMGENLMHKADEMDELRKVEGEMLAEESGSSSVAQSLQATS